MAKLHFCRIYRNRPDYCREYPWNDANEIFESCQFYNKQSNCLVSLDYTLTLKTQKEIEQYCYGCGKCCYYWEGGEIIHPCSGLKIIEEIEMKKILHTYRRGPCGWSTANWGHKPLANFMATFEPLIEAVEERHREMQAAGEKAELLEEVVPVEHPAVAELQRIAQKQFGVLANVEGCTRLAVHELYTPAVIRCQSGKEEVDEILEGDLLIDPHRRSIRAEVFGKSGEFDPERE